VTGGNNQEIKYGKRIYAYNEGMEWCINGNTPLVTSNAPKQGRIKNKN
jgi:hypothetical protein